MRDLVSSLDTVSKGGNDDISPVSLFKYRLLVLYLFLQPHCQYTIKDFTFLNVSANNFIS